MSPYHNVNKFNGLSNGCQESADDANKRPVQKVTPSRSATAYQQPNGNQVNGNSVQADCGYTKPNSPIKTSQTTGILQHNNVPSKNSSSVNGCQKPLTATVGYVNNSKTGQKPNK